MRKVTYEDEARVEVLREVKMDVETAAEETAPQDDNEPGDYVRLQDTRECSPSKAWRWRWAWR